MKFQKATRQQLKLRMGLVGPSGSGKTYTALAIATHLGQRVAVIDTERGSAKKYAPPFAFDVLELESFNPRTYIEAIREAEKAGFDVLVIDSLSHAWMGKDGALELVDRAAKRSQSGNSFAAWREVTPLHNELVDAILQARMHVLVTMRAKTEYVLEENDRGKKVPKKIGIQPVQRDGMEYEMDVTADLDLENTLIIGKTRCPVLHGRVFPKAGKDVAAILLGWLSDGAPAPAPPPAAAPADPVLSGMREDFARDGKAVPSALDVHIAALLEATPETIVALKDAAKKALKGPALAKYQAAYQARYRELHPVPAAAAS